ncbi:MAG TPA: DUF1553 domain-containing protein, partial [Planctomycetota bacterium]|nr:DUF1553 domain-containing protein [Planctomycetota bacterium]
ELSTLPAPLSSDTKGDRHLPHVTTEERRAWEARNAAIADPSRREPEPEIRALWDRGEPSPTYVYLRGDHHSPGPRVTPGVPSVLGGAAHFEVKPPWPGAKKTGRRLAFARWLTHPDHPLTARVMVNRLWKHHFGAGIVRTTGNFGKAGAQPTHPELLDWLALELVRQGWSLKAMHRLIMTSSTYRQALPARRMEAEVLRDTLLLAADRLDPTRYGPPDAVKTRPDGVVVVETSARSQGSTPKWRRSIYTQQMRKAIPTILESFDLPLMNPSCAERNESTVATQALHLLNDSWVRDLAASFAERVAREAGPDPERRILRASLIALGRSPTAEEAEIAVESLAGLSAQWEKDLASAVTPEPGAAALRGLSSFCHALFNSAAFLHVD